MKPKVFRPAALLTVIVAGALAACATQQQRISKTEDDLAAAGFVVKPANSEKRQDMLARLPPNKILQRVHGDNVHYVYADPTVCKCLYVGTQEAYSKFKQ
ncbi:MAG TPA: hypothetical protein VHY75_13405, partial [Steroidobacteraceae bacterium]|nr:hypothetical protein [Steroidobacteraceae bacterium]